VPDQKRISDLLRLAADQAGVVSRRQVLDAGLTDAWLKHQVKAERWARVHAGVYATFTGELTWDAQCWATLLRCPDGAALAGATALHHWDPGMPGVAAAARQRPIVIAVDPKHHTQSRDGMDVWTLGDLARHIHPTRRPPVLRYEIAVLLTASRARRADDAIATIANACQSRRTTPARLLRALDDLPGNLRLRGVITQILTDVATGAYSYLEVHYLRDVERPHGLPTGSRQRRVTVGVPPCYRDVEYVGLGTVAELDGRLGHEDFLSHAEDMDRDTGSARTARTARIGYVQVMSRRCATAQRVVGLLRLGGWRDRPRPCGPQCPVR
jgi:hypothetical protein